MDGLDMDMDLEEYGFGGIWIWKNMDLEGNGCIKKVH